TIGNGAPVNIPVSDLKTNTPQGVADAINAKGLTVRAAVVTTGDGRTLLQFSSTKTGEDNAFTVQGLTNGDPTNVFEGQNATITVGDPNDVAHTSYTITSSSNTFNNVVPGVTVTALKPTTTPVTVAVSSDSGKLADKMQALVDAANDALSSIA